LKKKERHLDGISHNSSASFPVAALIYIPVDFILSTVHFWDTGADLPLG